MPPAIFANQQQRTQRAGRGAQEVDSGGHGLATLPKVEGLGKMPDRAPFDTNDVAEDIHSMIPINVRQGRDGTLRFRGGRAESIVHVRAEAHFEQSPSRQELEVARRL